jgi:hypothetical protein
LAGRPDQKIGSSACQTDQPLLGGVLENDFDCSALLS